MRKLLALPFLPHERIITAFTVLENKAETSSQAIQDLVAYIDVNWIRSTTCPPPPQQLERVYAGCAHQQRRGGMAPSSEQKSCLYVLVPLLHREAKLVSIQMKLVSEGKLSRYHRRQYRTQQARLFNMWESFTDNELATAQLLSKCASVYGPTL